MPFKGRSPFGRLVMTYEPDEPDIGQLEHAIELPDHGQDVKAVTMMLSCAPAPCSAGVATSPSPGRTGPRLHAGAPVHRCSIR